MMNTFLIFFQFFLIIVAESDVFEKLSDVNERWLRATSFPEAAVVLKHPPYSYHSKLFSNNDAQIFELNPQKNGQNYNLSPVRQENSCSDDLIQILSNLDSEWALQMLDSDGKLSSGVMRGGIIWPGHFRECVSAYAPKDESGHGGFRGKYCVTSWSLNVTKKYSNLPLTVGLCVPDSCSAQYIKNLGKNILNIFERFPVLANHSSLLTLKNVSCKLNERNIDSASIIYLVFVFLFVCISVTGTVVTLIHKRKAARSINQELPGTRIPDNVTVNADEKSSLSAARETNSKNYLTLPRPSLDRELSSSDKALVTPNGELNDPAVEFNEKKPGFMQRIWLCFSVIENGKKILSTKSTGNQILSIHGIRFLSLTWVILGHSYITSVSIIGNRIDVLKEMDSLAFQVLLQAPFSVDSFFLLSGFLLAYLFLKEADKKNGKMNWIYFYVHRIWRLTPVYMIVVFFYLLVFKYLGSGPFWDDHHCDAARGSWWKYLLYINNFIPIHQMCVGWSWYLANDMQFYIISPLFLYPLWRWPVIGFSLLFSILIGTWVTTAVLSYQYDLIPMFVGATQAKNFDAYEARMWNSFDLIYDKPYCRIAPYIIGVALGFLLYRINQRKNFLSWKQQVLGWILALFCGLSVVFGLYHVEMSRTTALFYNSLCRSSFALALAWLIFVCETGHAEVLTKILSWKLWMPLSRLTYCAYLIHPILIHGYYLSYQTAFYFTEFVVVTSFFGFLVMSYIIAFLFSAAFESPLMNLEKLVLKTKTK